MKVIKIAVYSGVIPSTTFIENLIRSIAESGEEVYLFGRFHNHVNYPYPNVFLFPTPDIKWKIIFFVLRNKCRLWLKSRQRYQMLKQHVWASGYKAKRRWRLWAKYLPVVLHLPDIFHIQWAKATEEWFFLKELFGVKIVLSIRGAHINYSPLTNEYLADTYRRLFPKIDGFHAVSRAISKEAQKYGADPDKTIIIYSGVDLDKARQFKKNDYSISSPIKLLSVGRFHWKKGYHYALDALRILLNKGYNLHYTIIAGNPPEEILYQLHDLGLKDHVQIMDKLPQYEVFQQMQKADALLLPSVEEGIANVVLEAMAIGLPVISSNCGGMEEVIENRVNGLIFENRNTEHLAKQIEEFSKKGSTARKSMALAAISVAEKNHNLQKLGNEMKNFYYHIQSKSECKAKNKA